MKHIVWACLALLSIVVVDGASQTRPAIADGTVDAVALERGSVEARLNALVRILKVPPEQRNPTVVAALEREARRMVTVYRNKNVTDEAERDINLAYGVGLARALGESRRAEDIPLLIEYAGTGKMATDALALYGNAAVPALIRAAAGPRGDLSQRNGAMFALAEISRRSAAGLTPRLSADNARRIAALAHDLLEKHLTFGDVIVITALALATGRADLRTELEVLATSVEAWTSRGFVDTESIAQSQFAIQAQLKKQ
jgi:hypothetical protein